jgi:hypothetical protein
VQRAGVASDKAAQLAKTAAQVAHWRFDATFVALTSLVNAVKPPMSAVPSASKLAQRSVPERRKRRRW